jgi:hypothetical protein
VAKNLFVTKEGSFMWWILLGIVLAMILVGFSVFKRAHNKQQENKAEEYRQAWPVPGFIGKGLLIGTLICFGLGLFNKVFFYAQPGYVYHVRTITGQERVVANKTGYSLYLFGYYDMWKNAMSVTAGRTLAKGKEDTNIANSIQLQPKRIMFLDNVDATASATARFRIPTERDEFLKMAHEYRTPENLMTVALIPAFEETLDATGQMMSAEDFYAGAKTEFISEFDNQMKRGIYMVKRIEKQKGASKSQTKEADASKNGGVQDTFGVQEKTVWVVEKLKDKAGIPVRKIQNFTNFGIQCVETRLTNMNPNAKFIQRMQLKQQASADRAIAREQKIQEEEQRLLAVAKGDRQVAEQQAIMKVQQMQVTTEAETEKKKAIISANKLKEQATIQKATAQIEFERAKIDAEAVKVTADATAYAKEKVIKADNALAQKLATEERIQAVWADAYAKRNVPQYVFGGGGNTPVGGDTETSNFMKLMTMEAAKNLNYERNIETVVTQ